MGQGYAQVSVTTFEFGEFTLDCDRFELSRAGRSLKLERKPLELLILLAARHGDLVTRTEIADRLWPPGVFVDTEHGINTAVRKIRQALRDDPERPRFLETVPGKGYRFIASVNVVSNGLQATVANNDKAPAEPAADGILTPLAQKWPVWQIAAGICLALGVAGMAVRSSLRLHPAELRFTQLTDFTDSATAPTLSPDGRMVAFFRGSRSFETADQVYIKMLPNGEARRLTDDPRFKYGLSFSPDGSQVAYTVLAHPDWETYTVSTFGGESHLFLKNAAGLSWLDERQLLFSVIRGAGLHMGVVTGTANRQNLRDIYFPAHERGMAHYSFASPDRKSALVVEMNGAGDWAPCRLISLEGRPVSRTVGPNGACTSAGWSPDGSWMYFTAMVEAHSHLWRQRFPDGKPEQITFGPTEENGVAVEKDGRSIVTAMGEHESTIWIHSPEGDRCLSSEGEVAEYPPPVFGSDGSTLYYLLRRLPVDSGAQLWRTAVQSGKSEAVFPGVSMIAFDVSPDGKLVIYSASAPNGKSELWLAPIDRSYPARRIGNSGETKPFFGRHGQILFLQIEGKANYLERMNPDGSGRSKVVTYPIGNIQSISPGRRWLMAIAPLPDGSGVAPIAIPIEGGPPRRMYAGYTFPTWSTSGKWLFIPVEAPTRTSAGRSLAIPVGPGENLPSFPPAGIAPQADASVIPGAQSVNRAGLIPGNDPAHFAYVNTTVHRNLYRISLP